MRRDVLFNKHKNILIDINYNNTKKSKEDVGKLNIIIYFI